MPNLTGNPNQPVNVTIRALEPTDRAIPDLWNVPFQQLLNNDANLNQRVHTLENGQGGTTLAAHRTATTLDHPDGSVTEAKLADGAVTARKLANGAVTLQKLANTAFSAGPTPNTLALRNAQGAVLDGAIEAGHTILRVNGLYRWFGPGKWLRLVRWTNVGGTNKGLFADLQIVRPVQTNIGSRLRVRLETDESGNIINPAISLANDYNTVLINAALIQTENNTVELWGQFQFGRAYVSGIAGAETWGVEITPYGDVSSIVQDSPPTATSGGLYLEWLTSAVSQTFPGPGNIVAASRTPTSGYIRYDNGVQVAWATINIGSGTWTYPAAFASTPQVLATAQDSAPRLVTITSVSTTTAGILRTDLSGNTQSGTVHLWAIGLWK